jgi:succinyl-diaminopimelate desuccinylase
MSRPDLTPATLLASQLIRVDTTNPPGNESRATALIAERLRDGGLEPTVQMWDKGRANLVCTLPGADPGAPALLLSGHLDTVGVGAQPWSVDPFGGVVDGDRLYGRGSTDMKGGVAAMVVAFERLAEDWHRADPARSVVLALTASEETGCQGAQAILPLLPPIGAIVVGEATANHVGVGHKGVMWARLRVDGRTAHASRPDLGDNAVVRMAELITAVDATTLDAGECVLGRPTVTPTLVAGGSGRNVVPDLCECTLDIRLTTAFGASAAREVLGELIAHVPTCHAEVDLVVPPILTSERDPWLSTVIRSTGSGDLCTAAYFTDASVLAPALNDPPVCILGPGEPTLAHQVDEWCSVQAIDECVDIYQGIAEQWCGAVESATVETQR